MQRRWPTVRVTCSVALLIHCFAVGLTAAAAPSDFWNIAGQNEPQYAHSFIQPNDGFDYTTRNETPQHYDIEEGSTAIPIHSQGEQTGNWVNSRRGNEFPFYVEPGNSPAIVAALQDIHWEDAPSNSVETAATDALPNPDSRHHNLEEMMSKDNLAESSLATQSTTGLSHKNIGQGMKNPKEKHCNRRVPYDESKLRRAPLAEDTSEMYYKDRLAIDKEKEQLREQLEKAKVDIFESATILANKRPQIVGLIQKTVEALNNLELDTDQIKTVEMALPPYPSYFISAEKFTKTIRKIRWEIDALGYYKYSLKQIPLIIPESSTGETLPRTILWSPKSAIEKFHRFLDDFRSLVDTAVQCTRQGGDEAFQSVFVKNVESFALKIVPRLDELLQLHKGIEEAVYACKEPLGRLQLAKKKLYSVRDHLADLEKNERLLHANQLVNTPLWERDF